MKFRYQDRSRVISLNKSAKILFVLILCAIYIGIRGWKLYIGKYRAIKIYYPYSLYIFLWAIAVMIVVVGYAVYKKYRHSSQKRQYILIHDEYVVFPSNVLMQDSSVKFSDMTDIQIDTWDSNEMIIFTKEKSIKLNLYYFDTIKKARQFYAQLEKKIWMKDWS